jgi:hypothetical protein
MPPDDGSSLLGRVRDVVDAAVEHSNGQPEGPELQRLRDQLAGPLRIAVAGPTGAGTSTLVAALAAIAPPEVAVLDASEPGGVADPVHALIALVRPGPDGAGLAAVAGRLGVDPMSVAVLAVLNQADDVCGQQPEDWDEALALAVVCQQDPDLQRIGQPVTPVIGKLALAAVRLTDADVDALAALEDVPDEESGDPVLDRLGAFGVRLAMSLLHSGAVVDRPGLAGELARASGLTWLREGLGGQFVRRAQALRARSSMVELETLLSGSRDTAEPVLYRLEELRAGTHELAEIELADALADGSMVLLGTDRDAALRLLGTADSRPTGRLGLPEDATPEEIRAAVSEELLHWRRQSAHPAATSSVRRAAEILVRTCESLLAQTILGDRRL